MTEMNNASEASIKLWRLSLFIIFALPGIAYSSWVTRTPAIRDLLEVSTAEMGWIIFGLAVGSLIGLLFSSHAVAKKGARKIIFISGFFFMAGLALIGISAFYSSSLAVFISLLLFGLGYGFAEVALNVEGAALEHAMKKTLMPALHAGFSAGTLLGAGIGSVAAALEIPIFLHLSGMAVLLAVLLGFFNRNLQPGTGMDAEQGSSDEAPMTAKERLGVWKEKRLLLIGLVILGLAFTEGTANDWLPLIMVDGYHVSSATGSVVFSIFVGAMMISRLSGGYFLDRYGRTAVLRTTAIIAVIGILLVMFGQHYLIAAVGVVLWGLGAALGFPVCMSAASDDKRGAAARVGAIATIGYIAFLVGPPFIGVLGEHFGLLKALYVILACLGVSALLAGAVNPVGGKKAELKKNA